MGSIDIIKPLSNNNNQYHKKNSWECRESMLGELQTCFHFSMQPLNHQANMQASIKVTNV